MARSNKGRSGQKSAKDVSNEEEDLPPRSETPVLNAPVSIEESTAASTTLDTPVTNETATKKRPSLVISDKLSLTSSGRLELVSLDAQEFESLGTTSSDKVYDEQMLLDATSDAYTDISVVEEVVETSSANHQRSVSVPPGDPIQNVNDQVIMNNHNIVNVADIPLPMECSMAGETISVMEEAQIGTEDTALLMQVNERLDTLCQSLPRIEKSINDISESVAKIAEQSGSKPLAALVSEAIAKAPVLLELRKMLSNIAAKTSEPIGPVDVAKPKSKPAKKGSYLCFICKTTDHARGLCPRYPDLASKSRLFEEQNRCMKCGKAGCKGLVGMCKRFDKLCEHCASMKPECDRVHHPALCPRASLKRTNATESQNGEDLSELPATRSYKRKMQRSKEQPAEREDKTAKDQGTDGSGKRRLDNSAKKFTEEVQDVEMFDMSGPPRKSPKGPDAPAPENEKRSEQ